MVTSACFLRFLCMPYFPRLFTCKGFHQGSFTKCFLCHISLQGISPTLLSFFALSCSGIYFFTCTLQTTAYLVFLAVFHRQFVRGIALAFSTCLPRKHLQSASRPSLLLPSLPTELFFTTPLLADVHTRTCKFFSYTHVLNGWHFFTALYYLVCAVVGLHYYTSLTCLCKVFTVQVMPTLRLYSEFATLPVLLCVVFSC